MDNTAQINSPQEAPKLPLENQAPQVKKKLNWKGFGIGIIIVIIIEMVAFTALKSDNKQSTATHPTPLQAKAQFSPAVTVTTATPNKQNCTSTNVISNGLKTYSYSGATYCFSFNYPATWKADTQEPGSLVVLTAPPSPSCLPPHQCGGGLDGLSVSVHQNPNSLSLQDFIKEDKENMFSANHFTKNASSLGISTDWVIDRNAPGAGPEQEALIALGTQVIDLNCGSCSNETFDQILSTFTFANQTNTTAGWKTYTDAVLNASFQYPPDWNLSGTQKDPKEPNSENILFEVENTPYEVQISVEDNPQNLDYASFEKKLYPNQPDLYTNLSFKDISTNNNVTFKEIISGSAENGGIIAMYNKKLYALAIGATIKKPTNQEYAVLRQVAGTFKFTN